MPVKRFARIALSLLGCLFSLSPELRAQSSPAAPDRFEISARMGSGTLKIFGSNKSDSGLNTGFGFGVRLHHRFSVELEGDRVWNLKPAPVPCGLRVPCSGSAVEGVRSAFHFSANTLFYFGDVGGIRPYVLTGVGALRSHSAKAVTFGGPTQGVITQRPDAVDTGLSIGFGGGVRIPAGRRLVVRPEFRLYDATLNSRSNLSLIQTSVAIGYQFGQ